MRKNIVAINNVLKQITKLNSQSAQYKKINSRKII